MGGLGDREHFYGAAPADVGDKQLLAQTVGWLHCYSWFLPSHPLVQHPMPLVDLLLVHAVTITGYNFIVEVLNLNLNFKE
jgi:hypothetical protein